MQTGVVMEIGEVIRKHESDLLQLPNVVSIGIGERNGREVIIVFVKKKKKESELKKEHIIPKNLDGYKTVVEREIIVGQT